MAPKTSESQKGFSAVTVTDYGVLRNNIKKTIEEIKLALDLLNDSLESVEDGFDKYAEWLSCYSGPIKEWTRGAKSKATYLRKEVKHLHDSILLAKIDKN